MRRSFFLAALLPALLFSVPALAPDASAQTTVTWERLGQVRLGTQDGRSVPMFASGVRRLNGQTVRIRGYMIPLEQAPQQQHFLLSSFPLADCYYCLPGGPESFIDVQLNRAAAFSYEPVTVQGELQVMSRDSQGMYYRLTNARVVS